MSETTTTFGIDLGTTYSCISYLKDGHPTVCLSLEGEHTTPSVVRMMPEDPEPVVGKTAKDTSLLYPDDTIQFVKSKIGKMESFEIGDPDNRRTVTPVGVSAEILKKLASDASSYTNMPVKDVVITVPAYFGYAEREATAAAGREAGLNVIRIVEEPTAAAFYYLCEKDDTDATVCVYDLGGGTFDVTTIKKEGSTIQVITTDGDHDLGGKNWDAELINLVEAKFREATNLDEGEELESDFMQELQIKCENAKMQLTNAPSASIALSLDRQHKANIVVTREEFDDITSSLLQTSIDLTRKVIDETEKKGNKIDKLLLVGGSSKMPQIEAALSAEFSDRVGEILVNEPDESVSKGACIYCAWSLIHTPTGGATSDNNDENADKVTNVEQDEETGATVFTIAGQNGEERKVEVTLPSGIADTKIVTVATKSFGIETVANGDHRQVTNLIFKDDTLPAVFEESFGIQDDGQTSVLIKLYQSELKDKCYELEYGIFLGESSITGIPENQPAHSPVDIRITLNEQGLIVITAKYNGTPLNGELNTNYAEGVGTK